MLSRLDSLNEADALHWLTSRCDFTCPTGKLDVDPYVIASGARAGTARGAGVYSGARAAHVNIDALGEHAIIEGDIIVDGSVELHGGACFVFGNVACRSLYNAEGYLVIAGDLFCDRYLGVDETGATMVMGNAVVGSAVSFFLHGFDDAAVWGRAQIDHVVDELHGRGRGYQRLAEWGLETGTSVDWVRAREQLRGWAMSQSPISDLEAPPTFQPRRPAEPKLARAKANASDTIEAFEAWLKAKTPTQREKLAAIGTDWLARFADDERGKARHLVEKHISARFGPDLENVLKRLA